MDAFDRQAVHGILVYEGMVSTEVSILILLRLFKGLSTSVKAANVKPLHVMEHGPFDRGCQPMFSLYRKKDDSEKADGLIGIGTCIGPNRAQTRD